MVFQYFSNMHFSIFGRFLESKSDLEAFQGVQVRSKGRQVAPNAPQWRPAGCSRCAQGTLEGPRGTLRDTLGPTKGLQGCPSAPQGAPRTPKDPQGTQRDLQGTEKR